MKFSLDLNMNLNIKEYSFLDILELFQISDDFTEDDLKRCKKIVQRLHPDKSKLDSVYFTFFFSAYKQLYENWNTRIAQQTLLSPANCIYDTSTIDNDVNTTAAIHNRNTFNQNTTTEQNDDFINVFNSVYEEPASHQVGYGDWLKNENITTIDADEVTSLQVRPLEERATLGTFSGGYDLVDTGNGTFGSSLFSSFGYEDLKLAYGSPLIPEWDNKTTLAFINSCRQSTTYSPNL